MLAILTALALSQATFRPLGDCSLVKPVEFFEDLSALPESVLMDIKKRRKLFYSKTEKGVTFSDVIGPNDKVGPQLLYVARHKEQWLISYMYGGVAIRVVTVSYLQSERSETPYLMGALEGDGCKAANAFLDGLSVEQDWQR